MTPQSLSEPAQLDAAQDSVLHEINALEKRIVTAEDDADAMLWAQAQKVTDLQDAGLSQRQVSAQWTNARTGEPYSQMHVSYTVRAYREKCTVQPRPRFRDAYNEIANADAKLARARKREQPIAIGDLPIVKDYQCPSCGFSWRRNPRPLASDREKDLELLRKGLKRDRNELLGLEEELRVVLDREQDEAAMREEHRLRAEVADGREAVLRLEKRIRREEKDAAEAKRQIRERESRQDGETALQREVEKLRDEVYVLRVERTRYEMSEHQIEMFPLLERRLVEQHEEVKQLDREITARRKELHELSERLRQEVA